MPRARRATSRIASPLTGAPALRIRLNLEGDAWFLVREADGLSYVVGEALSPRTPQERAAMLLAARSVAGNGATAVFVREADRAAFARWRPSLYVDRVEPWAVRD